MHRHREEHLLDWPGTALLAALDGRVGHALEDLERVAVRAAVLVDRHEKPIYQRVWADPPDRGAAVACAGYVLSRRPFSTDSR